MEEKNQIIKKYWAPISEILQLNIKICKDNNCEKIIELGPGSNPFSLSNYFIEHNTNFINKLDSSKTIYNLNLNNSKLDVDENYFDFCYARHIFEDVQNPDFIFNNITKQCKLGYIETPSPLIECLRNVDATNQSYRGYIHHRYIVWTNNENNELHFLPKMPIIEYILINKDFENFMYEYANKNPLYWNNYYWWDKDNNKLPKIIMHEFDCKTYSELLMTGILKSIQNTTNLINHQH